MSLSDDIAEEEEAERNWTEYRSYSEPMEAFEVYLHSEERFAHLLPDDHDVWAVPSIMDAVQGFAQDAEGERQTGTLPGMEDEDVLRGTE